MAGIGFELRKIYGRKTLASSIWGTIYATMTTIGPSVIFALLLLCLKFLLQFTNLKEIEHIFFISTFTYSFLVAILVSSVFNTVLSRYISDCVFAKREDKIMSSVYGSLIIGSAASGIIMLILCILMYVNDGIPLHFLILFYLLGVLATNAYNLITYVSALKEYKEVTLSYCSGAILVIGLFLLCHYVFMWHAILAAYVALISGFFLINVMLIYYCRKAFGQPDSNYFEVTKYFKQFPKLIISGSTYIMGFFVSTILYWFFSNMRVSVSIFSTAPRYDLAFFLAIVVNMPALVIFVVKSETAFFDRYVYYLSALNSSNYAIIERERKNMTNVIKLQLFYVYEVQLIIVVVLICLANVFFPYLNIGTEVLNIFMILSMGIYCTFCMYFTIIFLYYFEDQTAACIAPCVFFVVTLVLSIFALFLKNPYYPVPILIGAVISWIVAFRLLNKRLNNLNSFLMCK